MSTVTLYPLFFLAYISLPKVVFAASSGSEAHINLSNVFLFFAILLFAAKIGGVVEKFGQPSVLGELAAGIVLSFFAFIGFGFIEEIRQNSILLFLAEFGAVLLLFKIGLESNIGKMTRVGFGAFFVAIIGVVVPFALGAFLVGPYLFPYVSFTAHLFIGASLVATSVGITASVFQNLNAIKSRACQIVLAAAVIDDVLGLLILAIVSAVASGNSVTLSYVSILAMKSFGFLIIAITFGNLFAKSLSRLFSLIHTGTGMKFSLALIFALIYVYIAQIVGLAPIIGAFAAGLVLDAVHFKDFNVSFATYELQKIQKKYKKLSSHLDEYIHKAEHTHIERMISSMGLIFIPLFFTYTGLQIDFSSLLNPSLYVSAILLSIAAIFGKIISGYAAPGDWREKMLVGVSMIPRGEVGLIFASTGKALGVVTNELYSIIVLVIIITTGIAPILIKTIYSMKHKQKNKYHKKARLAVVPVSQVK